MVRLVLHDGIFLFCFLIMEQACLSLVAQYAVNPFRQSEKAFLWATGAFNWAKRTEGSRKYFLRPFLYHTFLTSTEIFFFLLGERFICLITRKSSGVVSAKWS